MSTLRFFMGDLCNLPTLDIGKNIPIPILVTYSSFFWITQYIKRIIQAVRLMGNNALRRLIMIT